MIASIFSLVSVLLPIVMQKLHAAKTISASTGSLITGIGEAATAFTAEVTANGASGTATAILGGLSAALVILKAELPADGSASVYLLYIVALEGAVAAGIAAANITVVDPSALKPVEAA